MVPSSARAVQKSKICLIFSLDSPVMELHQLEYFVAVVEEASFTRAAARVHVAQPGVSAQVRRLEQELGEQLLDRSGRTVRPTDVGRALLPYARAALDAVEGARCAVDELTALVRGRVTVGMVSGCALPLVPDILAKFRRAHPAVDIVLTEANSEELVHSLREGHLDLALVGAVGAATPGLDSVVLIDEHLVAVVSHHDPLSARKTITVEALRDRPLICLPRGTGVRAALDRACSAAGFQPRIAFEVNVLETVARLAGEGLGLAIVPISTTEVRDDLHVLTITRPRLRSRLELTWPTGGPNSPAGRALVEVARDHLHRAAAATTTGDEAVPAA
jgi:DNA-binding transcriptional LysR family regulator